MSKINFSIYAVNSAYHECNVVGNFNTSFILKISLKLANNTTSFREKYIVAEQTPEPNYTSQIQVLGNNNK